METDREYAAEEPGWDMDVPFPRGGYFWVGRAGGGDLRRLPSEHLCEIYCNKAHYIPVSGGGVTARISVIKAVVVTGDTRSRGDMGGGSGGGGGNGLGGVVRRGSGERYG